MKYQASGFAIFFYFIAVTLPIQQMITRDDEQKAHVSMNIENCCEFSVRRTMDRSNVPKLVVSMGPSPSHPALSMLAL
jgi:hypothetical protein